MVFILVNLITQKIFIMKNIKLISVILFLLTFGSFVAQSRISPEKIKFVRQGVKRFIFDNNQSILLASIIPEEVIGMSVMYPIRHYLNERLILIL